MQRLEKHRALFGQGETGFLRPPQGVVPESGSGTVAGRLNFFDQFCEAFLEHFPAEFRNFTFPILFADIDLWGNTKDNF